MSSINNIFLMTVKSWFLVNVPRSMSAERRRSSWTVRRVSWKFLISTFAIQSCFCWFNNVTETEDYSSLSPGIVGRVWGFRNSPSPPHIWDCLCPWEGDSQFSHYCLRISSCCCQRYHKRPSELYSLRAKWHHSQGKPQPQPFLVHLPDLKYR